MTNPYRAMCAELADVVYEYCILHEGRDHLQPLVDRARALLADPEPEGPTNETPWEIDDDDFLLFSPANAMAFQAQKRSRRGRPTPQPEEGEVAELTARLRAIRNDYGVKHSADCQRAADLLERLASDNAGFTAAADSLWADNVSLLDN